MVKIHIVYYSTYGGPMYYEHRAFGHTILLFSRFLVRYGHIVKMAEEMASAISVSLLLPVF